MTDAEIDKKASKAMRAIMNTRTSERLYCCLGYSEGDLYFDVSVDDLELEDHVAECLKRNGYETLGDVTNEMPMYLRRKEGLENYIEDILCAAIKYDLQERDMTLGYALRRHLPLYKILGYEDISRYRNIPVDAYTDSWIVSRHSKVIDAATQSGVLTLHELLTLDLDSVYGMMREHPVSYDREPDYFEKSKVVDHSAVFDFLVSLDYTLRNEDREFNRFFSLIDIDESPQPVTYPIDSGRQYRVRCLLDDSIAGEEVSPDGLLPEERDLYSKAAGAVEDCGPGFYEDVTDNPEYYKQLAEAFRTCVKENLKDVEEYAWIMSRLYGIPECIRNMKVSKLEKFYDLHRKGMFDFLEDDERNMTVYDFLSSYIKEALADLDQFNQRYVDEMDNFLSWAGTLSMDQVIKETFTMRMDESSRMPSDDREEAGKVAALVAGGMSRQEAGRMLGISNMKVASDERYMVNALWEHLSGFGGYCRHDLVATYFLLNYGETVLDKKTLEGIVGPVYAYIYWMYIVRTCEEVTNYLYKYSPEDDVIYMKYVRKKTADAGLKKPKRGRPKGSKNKK